MEDRRLYRIMRWGYYSLIPFTVLFAVVAVLTNSSTMVIISALNVISLTVQAFSLYAMRRVIAPNPFGLPFGAGKLEDFSAFLCGVLFVPSGLYMAYVSILELISPEAVGYALGMIPVFFSALRLGSLYAAVRRLSRETAHPSLLLRAYFLDYRIGVLTDVSVFVTFGLGWLLMHNGQPALGNRIDPAVTLVLALYALWSGISLVRHSFRPLMDLPLPETDLLKIMKVLAAHYTEYDDIEGLYTRASGRKRFVDVEIVFPGGSTLSQIDALSSQMERELAAAMPGLVFEVRPLIEQGEENCPATPATE